MKLEPMALPAAYLLAPEPLPDERGFFARTFDANELDKLGLEISYPQWSISYNSKQGTLRGMHWQSEPHMETKLVQCIKGAVFDVIVDVRPQSETFGKWCSIELSEYNRYMLYIPEGFAHGFQTLEDKSELLYHISVPFQPGGSRGIRWDDPDLAISWPFADKRIISDRDLNLPLLADISNAP